MEGLIGGYRFRRKREKESLEKGGERRMTRGIYHNRLTAPLCFGSFHLRSGLQTNSWKAPCLSTRVVAEREKNNRIIVAVLRGGFEIF